MESDLGAQSAPTSRRAARELALRALYHIEATKASANVAIEACLETMDVDESVMPFAIELVSGTYANRNSLDAIITDAIKDKWELLRLAATDRAVLRIACYELFHCPGIPPKATINEAIVLAKKYGAADSGKFVNGVLGTVLQRSPKFDWNPELATVIETEGELPEPEVEVEKISEDSEEYSTIVKAGAWKIKAHDAGVAE